MDFQKVGVLWNPTKRAGLETARELNRILASKGVRVVNDVTLASALGIPEREAIDDSDCQLLIVLGGDGTVLSALDFAMPGDIPLLGVNLGRLGFLTEIEPARIREDVEALLAGRYAIDRRMTMRAEGCDEAEYFALNEIVFTRASSSLRMISLEIDADGTMVDRISGDGIIIASATGSTAYSLSAGGPIVSPGLDCFVLTPVCPHTMNARPVVLSANSRITVRVIDPEEKAQAVFDGKRSLSLASGGPGMTIVKSERCAKFVRLHDRNYFSLLRGKLSEWTH